MNDLEKDQYESSYERGVFSRIVKYFSKDSTGVKILFIVGIASVFLGFWQIVGGIKNSFVISPIVLKDKAAVISGLNRLKDTDGDSLSDYDELNTYNTSPYLSDTDSDGVSDYNEVILGQGQENATSSGVTFVNEDSQGMTETFLADMQTMTIEEFKKELASMDYDQQVIDQITPDNFGAIKQQIYDSIKSVTPISDSSSVSPSTANTNNDASSNNLSTEDIKNLKDASIEEIKTLLKQQGATDEQLKQIPEARLRELYNISLDEMVKDSTNKSLK